MAGPPEPEPATEEDIQELMESGYIPAQRAGGTAGEELDEEEAYENPLGSEMAASQAEWSDDAEPVSAPVDEEE